MPRESEVPACSWRALQERVWANKVVKGFNTTDVPLEMALLNKELGEFFDAWRYGRTDEEGPELADVAIFLLSLAQMRGVDLGLEVAAKMRVNDAREYVRVGGAAWAKAASDSQ